MPLESAWLWNMDILLFSCIADSLNDVQSWLWILTMFSIYDLYIFLFYKIILSIEYFKKVIEHKNA